MTDEQRLQRSLEWMETIYQGVTNLLVHHHIFWEVQEIIKNNNTLMATPSAFYEWMGKAFVVSAAASVRRQADRSDDGISLRRLLEELKAYPHLISREYFVALHPSQTPQDLLKQP